MKTKTPKAAVRTRARHSAAMPPYDTQDAAGDDQQSAVQTAELELSDVMVVEIPLALIDPHPRNPGRHRITEESIRQLADDIATNDLQQPIKVRPSGNRYELIFGERRFRACQLLAADNYASTIPAIVESATDRRVAALQAVENAQRVDIDLVAKAEHLADMTTQQPDGSPALTQSEAGDLYGISQGEVSNLIRLLRLPKAWRDLLRSGKLTRRQALAVVPYAETGKILDVLLIDFTATAVDGWSIWQGSEDELERGLVNLALRASRPIDKKHKHQYRFPMNAYPRLFELTPDLRTRLGVVLAPIGERPKKGAARVMVERATNVELWHELNDPLVGKREAARKTKASGKTESEDRDGQAEGFESAAKGKAVDDKRQAQLAVLIDTWRHRMIRATIAEHLERDLWLAKLIGTWALTQAVNGYGQGCGDELLLAAIAAKRNEPLSENEKWLRSEGRGVWFLWRGAVNHNDDPVSDVDDLLGYVATLALWPVNKHAQAALGNHVVSSTLPKLTDRILDVSECFRTLEAGGDPGLPLHTATMTLAWQRAANSGTQQRALFEQLLEAHRKPELLDLGKELGCPADDKQKHAELVQHVLDNHRPEHVLHLPVRLKRKNKGQ